RVFPTLSAGIHTAMKQLLPAVLVALVPMLAHAVRPTLSGPEVLHPTADGHLLIHYTLSGADALPDVVDTEPANGIPDAVDDVEVGMHAVWAAFVDTDGWSAPLPDMGQGGDDKMDVYLRVIDANGYAHYEAVPGGYTSYMEVANTARGFGSLTLQSIA